MSEQRPTVSVTTEIYQVIQRESTSKAYLNHQGIVKEYAWLADSPKETAESELLIGTETVERPLTVNDLDDIRRTRADLILAIKSNRERMYRRLMANTTAGSIIGLLSGIAVGANAAQIAYGDKAPFSPTGAAILIGGVAGANIAYHRTSKSPTPYEQSLLNEANDMEAKLVPLEFIESMQHAVDEDRFAF